MLKPPKANNLLEGSIYDRIGNVGDMAPRQRALVRIALFAVALIGLLVLYRVQQSDAITETNSIPPSKLINPLTQYPLKEKLESLSLTEEQCAATFPHLTKEIEDSVARGPFELKKVAADLVGVVQGKIKDRKVHSYLANFSCKVVTDYPTTVIYNLCWTGSVTRYAPGVLLVPIVTIYSKYKILRISR